MKIYTSFPSGWWTILAIVYGIYVGAYLLRTKKSLELWPQLKSGLVCVLLAFLIEFTAVSLNLWNYTPGNWPIILWIGYFGVGLAGYQINKKLEEQK